MKARAWEREREKEENILMEYRCWFKTRFSQYYIIIYLRWKCLAMMLGADNADNFNRSLEWFSEN